MRILNGAVISLTLIAALVMCIGCDDDRSAPSGLPVTELVIYRHGLEDQVRLAWRAKSNCDGYRVLRAFDSRGPYTLVAQVADTNWIDREFPAQSAEDSLVFYRVAGIRYDGEFTPMSNTVGYYHFVADGQESMRLVSTPFGLPFVFWQLDDAGKPIYGYESFRPSEIIGDQATAGGSIGADKIAMQGGSQAFRDTRKADSAWTDPLEENAEMGPGMAYWYGNKSGRPIDIYLMGEVDYFGRYSVEEINDPGEAGSGYATPYSWRIARPVPVGELGLLEQGFTGGGVEESDQIVAQDGSGDFAVYFDAEHEWYPPDFEVLPGRAYWIINKHSGHEWYYEYRP